MHLPQQNEVFFQDNAAVQLNNDMVRTTLTELMNLCKHNPFAKKTLYYVDIPQDTTIGLIRGGKEGLGKEWRSSLEFLQLMF